jgi:hypothetical protein
VALCIACQADIIDDEFLELAGDTDSCAHHLFYNMNGH